MDAFKLAFETILVGALAIPWIGMMVVLLNRNLSGGVRQVARIVPKPCTPAAVGVAAFSFAYLLGSAITPVAQEFLSDMDSIGLPTQETIQARIVADQNASRILLHGGPRYATLAAFRDTREQEKLLRVTGAIFHRQESTLLLGTTEVSERLNRLHERLTVLTGATFSGFALSLLLIFAWCGTCRGRAQAAQVYSGLLRSVRQAVAYAPAIAIVLWGSFNLVKDWHKHSVDDPPILEAVLLILGFFGLCVTARGTPVIASLGGKLLFVSFLTVLSYGGYISTEPTYVHEVMDSYAAMTATPVSAGSHSAAATLALVDADDDGLHAE